MVFSFSLFPAEEPKPWRWSIATQAKRKLWSKAVKCFRELSAVEKKKLEAKSLNLRIPDQWNPVSLPLVSTCSTRVTPTPSPAESAWK